MDFGDKDLTPVLDALVRSWRPLVTPSIQQTRMLSLVFAFGLQLTVSLLLWASNSWSLVLNLRMASRIFKMLISCLAMQLQYVWKIK